MSNGRLLVGEIPNSMPNLCDYRIENCPTETQNKTMFKYENQCNCEKAVPDCQNCLYFVASIIFGKSSKLLCCGLPCQSQL